MNYYGTICFCCKLKTIIYSDCSMSGLSEMTAPNVVKEAVTTRGKRGLYLPESETFFQDIHSAKTTE